MRLVAPPAVLLLLVLAAPGVRADDDLDAKEIARLKAEMELRARIAPAVDKAVAWLGKQQQPDGTFGPATGGAAAPGMHRFGRTALAALALVHGGVGVEDPRIANALAWLHEHWREVQRGSGTLHGSTYSLSLFAMLMHTAYERRGAPPDAEPERTNPCGLPGRDLAVVRAIARWLLETRVRDSLFGYPRSEVTVPSKVRRRMPKDAFELNRVDLSNTQYALLGLWACSRCGVKVPESDLASIAEALFRAQATSGPAVRRHLDPAPGGKPGAHVYVGLTDRARGFGYTMPAAARQIATVQTGSMTAGGLSSLLVVKAILHEQEQLEERLGRRLDHAIWDAVAWLDRNYSVEHVPTALDIVGFPAEQAKLLERQVPDMGDMWFGYYLYGLARALVIAGKRTVGVHDWYLEGAALLLGRQVADGHWFGPRKRKEGDAPAARVELGSDALVDTCFGVLFLQRATLRPRAPLIEVAEPTDR